MKLLIITQKVDQDDQLLGFFVGWIKEFAKNFKTIAVLCLERGNYGLPDNVQVIGMGKDKNKSKLGQLFNFYRAIIMLEYDAVFVHMNPVWMVLGGPYWRLMGRKSFLWYTSKGVTLKLRLAEKLADIILTASPESFRLPSNKVFVTGHGIDTDLFVPDSGKKMKDGVLRILSVGRIAPVKNYEILIEAAKMMTDKGLKFEISLIGAPALDKDKNYESKIRAKIKKLNLDDYFKFIGKVNNKELPSYYQSYNLFIHLSKTGSLDKTLLEAMACGMQVLSSNDAAQGFLPTGSLFKEDDPKELADKIMGTSVDAPDGQLRRYVIERHNLDALISKITKLLINK
ncbi:MAG: hypothetical protein A2941_00650 [Candidatus Yanofskybacteria bacterium RIFCSPLOWO2_01_FULL_49_17]|uniref:Glycosyl transferase family 1 domain-containing protein n=1 Tax=Candidatus Yanofskybacteria bacterium RIFCSPLOWO2_01_FULL_49_17 TaxID=1802700 RepID=A0A1F8GR14_9BACT|nr:MAG: hypothetical protein A2941_00650 [Candidatus Yanofskybacteria bacterium RIFCSPLOWO2_01_FULL_49_17]